MPDISLNSADKQIIEVLEEGRNTPSNIARRLDYSREYVSQRLKRLREHGLVERVDRGLYELTIDDSEQREQDETESSEEGEGASRSTDGDTDSTAAIDAALEGWEYGRSDEEKHANMELAKQATAWLREADRDVSRADVPLNEFADEDPLDRSADTVWTEVVRGAWQHAAEQGYIERPHNRAYRWSQ